MGWGYFPGETIVPGMQQKELKEYCEGSKGEIGNAQLLKLGPLSKQEGVSVRQASLVEQLPR